MESILIAHAMVWLGVFVVAVLMHMGSDER